MVKPVVVEKAMLKERPELLWNGFMQFLAKAETMELNDVQMAAQLPWIYDAEVMNGGHLQYFENQYKTLQKKLNILVMATIDALKIIGAKKQAEILKQASERYFSLTRQHPVSVEVSCKDELEGEFEDLDTVFYDCEPDISHYLEEYLKKHTADFITLV
jgi:hypothetical protein